MLRFTSPRRFVSFALLSLLTLAAAPSLHAQEIKKDEAKESKDKAVKLTYDEHIKPIFRDKCFSCHNGEKKTAGLDLTTYIGTMQGGGSGDVVERGNAGASYLYLVVNHDAEPYMPPMADKLPEAQLALVRGWIDGGALENDGSKPFVSNKPKVDLTVKDTGLSRPAGPAPLPGRLSLEPVVHTKNDTAITAIANNPWSPLVAVAGQRQILLYHAGSLEPLGVLPFPEGVAHVLKFSRNGSLLLAAGGRGAYRGKAVLFDVRTGERVAEIGDELDAVLAADINADQSLVALGGPSKMIRVYRIADGSLAYELKKHTDWIYSAAFSPDGVLLATSDRNGGLMVWEAFTGREYLTLNGHTKAVGSIAWRLDSNLLASASEDGSIKLWEMNNGGVVKTWNGHGNTPVESIDFARNGRIVTVGRDKIARLWDQAGTQIAAFDAFKDFALRVSFSDETNRVVAGDWTGEVRVFSVDPPKLLGNLSANPLPLKDRVAAIAAQFNAAREEAEKQQAAASAAQAAFARVQADLAAAQKQLADAKTTVEKATASVNTQKAAIPNLTRELEAAKKSAADLEPVVKLLAETSAKANETAAKIAADKEIAAAAGQFKTLLDQRTASLKTAQQTVTDKTAALTAAQQEQANAEKQLADANVTIAAATKQIADLTAAVQPAQDRAAAAKTAADAAVQKASELQQSLARWQQEVAYSQQSADTAQAAK